MTAVIENAGRTPGSMAEQAEGRTFGGSTSHTLPVTERPTTKLAPRVSPNGEQRGNPNNGVTPAYILDQNRRFLATIGLAGALGGDVTTNGTRENGATVNSQEVSDTPTETTADTTFQFSDLMMTHPVDSAPRILDRIVNPALLETNGRYKEVYPTTRAAIRFGPLATLIIHTDEKGSDYVDDKGKFVGKPKGEFIFTAVDTTDSLDDATIASTKKSTLVTFPTFTNSTGEYTTDKTIKITNDGIERSVNFAIHTGDENPLYTQLSNEKSDSLTLPPDGPRKKGKTYSLEGATTSHEDGRIRIILPAEDHLSSSVVTTFEITPTGVTKTDKIIPEGVAYQVEDKVKKVNGREIHVAVVTDRIAPDMASEVETALGLQQDHAAQLAEQIADGEIVVFGPALRDESEGEYAAALAKAEAKQAKTEADARKARERALEKRINDGYTTEQAGLQADIDMVKAQLRKEHGAVLRNRYGYVPRH